MKERSQDQRNGKHKHASQMSNTNTKCVNVCGPIVVCCTFGLWASLYSPSLSLHKARNKKTRNYFTERLIPVHSHRLHLNFAKITISKLHFSKSLRHFWASQVNTDKA